MPILRQWLDLPPAEKRLLFAAARWALTFRLALWILPLRTVLALSRRAARPRACQTPDEQIVLVNRAVRRAARLVPRATCLTRALTTHALLGRRGIATQLRIGVIKDDNGQLQAHAWLERAGVKLLPAEDGGAYLTFPAIDLLQQSSRP